MKLKIKSILASSALAIMLLTIPQINALADGPPYNEKEPNNFNFAANKISLYDNVNATLPKGDVDWYKIYIPTSDTYEFNFGNTYNTNSLSTTISATIYDSNNKVVFTGCPDESGKIVFDGTLQGLYYIQVNDAQNTTCENAYSFELFPKNGFRKTTYRFAGIDRYETSYNIFKNNWNYCSCAVITSGEDFPDALSAAPLAKKYNAPIILTSPKELSMDVENQLKETGVKNVFIIGGYGSMSKDIENKLVSMGITCTRIWGKDRYETSLAVAKYLNPNGSVAIANGSNFPDAISIASIAASKEMPILLVDKNSSNSEVVQYIKDNKISNTYIIGGTGVVSTETENYLSQFTTAKRLAGSDRYETNIEVLLYFKDSIKRSEAYFASGLNFPDALSASVLAASDNHPIILIDKDPVFLTKNYLCVNRNDVINKCILGGESIIPTSLIQDCFN